MVCIKYIVIFLLCLFLPFKIEATNKAVVDITSMNIEDMAVALHKGYITSELLVQLYLDRIEMYDSHFNTINQINENALEEARVLDEERQKGQVRGILHGIPILVKTNIDVVGLATTAGAISLKDNYPIEDAEVIKKLKDAGAIILGSTNMSQFAFSAIESRSSYGVVKNAFNIDYTSGGSSGGSAVAVALSFAAAALGTDTNSSVRIPASVSGLVGLRPTFDLISTNGVIPYDLERDTVGVLTKTVEDNAIVMGAINNENKTYQLNNNFDLADIRIGVIDSYVYGSDSEESINSLTNSDIALLTDEKIKLLEENGAEIVHINILINEYYKNIASFTMTGGSFCDGFNNYIVNTTGRVRSFSDLINSAGLIYNISGYGSYCGGLWRKSDITLKKAEFAKRIEDVMDMYEVDIILYPSQKNKTFKLNSSGSFNSPGSFLSSVIGYPALTISMGMIDGLPYGLEFMSTKNNEELLYNVANTFEKINENGVINSLLTPNLYSIPTYVNDLIEYYDTYYNNGYYMAINEKAREFFKEYNLMSEDEAAGEVTKLLKEYEDNIIEEKKEIKNKEIKSIIFIGIGLLIGAGVVFANNKIKRKRRRKKR